jgi:predicted TPR repeat methyltransferase
MDGNFEQARDFFVQGLDHYQSGRFAAAELQFAASLALLPGRVSSLTNLGATRLKLGKFRDAADLLEEAVAKEPDNVEALAHLATALAELGHAARALACVERALQVNPDLGPAWTLRGSLLKELGRLDDARAAFRNAIEHGADTSTNHYQLASLGAEGAPRTAPREYVQALFDGYADGFEEHLVQVLRYRAPDILVEGLVGPDRVFARALDLGCGTGLCGLKLRPLARQLHGVDLSGNMVERAARRGVYDEVVHDDLAHFLNATPNRYDLVLAADVFIYVGALEDVFAGVARVLEPGGLFCFSVEKAQDGREFELRRSMRYAHSPGYIQKLAVQFGFEFRSTAEHSIRDDQRTPIPGFFAWLVRP